MYCFTYASSVKKRPILPAFSDHIEIQIRKNRQLALIAEKLPPFDAETNYIIPCRLRFDHRFCCLLARSNRGTEYKSFLSSCFAKGSQVAKKELRYHVDCDSTIAFLVYRLALNRRLRRLPPLASRAALSHFTLRLSSHHVYCLQLGRVKCASRDRVRVISKLLLRLRR